MNTILEGYSYYVKDNKKFFTIYLSSLIKSNGKGRKTENYFISGDLIEEEELIIGDQYLVGLEVRSFDGKQYVSCNSLVNVSGYNEFLKAKSTSNKNLFKEEL